MTERTRDFLKPQFRDGERPSGEDFADLIDSFVSKATDGVAVDADGDLVLSRGVRLGNSAGTTAGGLRFSGGQVQFHNGTTWTSLSTGSAGAFAVLTPTATAYTAGNVGIGSAFTAAAPPTYRLQVTLGTNSGPAEQVKFGDAVVANDGVSPNFSAIFAHASHATRNNYALRQSVSGDVRLNAPTGQPVSIRQNGNSVRLGVSTTGNVIVGGENDLVEQGEVLVPPAPPLPRLQVNGQAFKNAGGNLWQVPSDARLKEDVRDLEAGLAQLCRVRPVRFRYNGRAGTHAGLAGVGVLGQEIETVFPEMIQRVSLGAGEAAQDDLRIFDGSALTFVLINAVKELAAKVDQLEAALAAQKRSRPRRSAS